MHYIAWVNTLHEYIWNNSLQERCPLCDVSTVHSEHPEAIGMVKSLIAGFTDFLRKKA